MSAQTSYSLKQPKAYAGMIYAVGFDDIFSMSVETAAGIGFGVAVTRGTDPELQCKLATSGSFFGITVRSLEREGAANTGAIKYSQYETAGIMREGYIWVVCPTGCTAGDPVLYTNGTGVLDAGTAGAGETQLNGANWETTAAAGELAVIRLTSDSVTVGS